MGRRDWPTVILAALCCAVVVGCAEGPLYQTGHLFPWSRNQWAADERHGPTVHARQRELAELRTRAASLPPDEATATATRLAARYDQEGNQALRIDLLMTIADLPATEADAFLARRRSDNDPQVREACCLAWGRRGQRGATTQAAQRLAEYVAEDAERQVRLAALRELGELGADQEDSPTVRAALAKSLDDPDPAIQLRTVRTLSKRTGRDFGGDVRAGRTYLAEGTLPPRQASLPDPLGLFR